MHTVGLLQCDLHEVVEAIFYMKQDGQRRYSVTFRRFHVTTVTLAKR